MKTKIGHILMTIGALMVISSLGLLIYNNIESSNAKKASTEVLPVVRTAMEEEKEETERNEEGIAVTEIDGNEYMGVLTAPSLNMEAPVMSSWDYKKLKISPCRQFGSYETDDLVIAGHNYRGLFGELHNLKQGDEIIFEGADKSVNIYEVGILEVIPADYTNEVMESSWDLILYTCTYDGVNRIMAGCKRVSEI